MKVKVELFFESGKTKVVAKHKYKKLECVPAGYLQDIVLSEYEAYKTSDITDEHGFIEEIRVYLSGSITPLTFPVKWLEKNMETW